MYALLDSNIVARGFKNVVSVFLEILMYLIVVGVILFIIATPNTPFEMRSEFDSGSSFSTSINIKEITQMIIIFKVLLFLCTLPALFCAVLLHRNRNKGNLMRRAFEETKQMKTNFDKALRDFNL
jgi:preprotein translocase subunit SecG